MKILILTSVYPEPDDISTTTPVVHYFAKEWVKQGLDVFVIHNANSYPLLFYKLPKFLLNFIHTIFSVQIPSISQRTQLESKKDGVSIIRLPMLKYIPHGNFSTKTIRKQYNKIIRILKDRDYTPDLIIGHWENPQIPLLSMLKKDYRVKNVIVCHGTYYLTKQPFANYIKNIDVIGTRSLTLAHNIKNILDLNKLPFIAYSGIPDHYLNSNPPSKFKKDRITKFIYVGLLYKRKNVDTIISALAMLDNKDFSFDIIGNGVEREKLQKVADKLDLSQQVNFLGRLPRQNVQEKLLESECFIMVSQNEVFGLVYLEAMAKGCIVIASKGGGMDGIIENGVNGFLCEAGNEKELYFLIDKIMKLNIEEKNRISIEAYKTACQYTDSIVAKNYLLQIQNNDN